MFGRGTLFLLLLAAAFFVPYALSGPEASNPMATWWDSLWTDSINDAYPTATTSPIPSAFQLASSDRLAYAQGGASYMGPSNTGPLIAGQAQTSVPTGATSELPADRVQPGEWRTVRTYAVGSTPQPVAPAAREGGSPGDANGPWVQNGADLIRFDLTPEWVMQNWPRVSTHLHEKGLDGMRVAVVSGTGLRDLAGSLTYYFNQQNQMDRLVFNGSTGDPAYLVRDLSQRFGLEHDRSLGRNVYVKRDEEQLIGWLRVSTAAIVRASQPLQRYDIQLELTRPGSQVPLSSRFVPKQP